MISGVKEKVRTDRTNILFGLVEWSIVSILAFLWFVCFCFGSKLKFFFWGFGLPGLFWGVLLEGGWGGAWTLAGGGAV